MIPFILAVIGGGLIGSAFKKKDDPKFKEGGYISNQYIGKSAEQVWDEWTMQQREHFLNDHKKDIKEDEFYTGEEKALQLYRREDFKKLPKAIKEQITFHVSEGAYAKGGGIPNNYKDKSSAKVWEEWTPQQRGHFFKDHYKEFQSADWKFDGDAPLSYEKIAKTYTYEQLPILVQIVLGEHIQEGEYKKGGKVKDSGKMSKEEFVAKTIVYDNGGKTFDRYTVFTPDGSVYGMSETASGFNQYCGEADELAPKGSHLGKRLKSVPKEIEWAVIDRMEDEYATGGKVKNPVYSSLWYAIKEHQDWDKNEQHELHGLTWAKAIKEVKEIANKHKKEVRLSTSKGYNNQGHYVYFDYKDGGKVDHDSLKGKYIKVYYAGVKEPDHDKIKDIKITPSHFDNRYVIVTHIDGSESKFPLSKLEEFETGHKVEIKSGKEPYLIQLDGKDVELPFKDGGTMARGGFCSKGEMVWGKITDSKKADFLYKNFTPQITPRSQEILVGKTWNFLPKNVKIKFESEYANVESYGDGGSLLESAKKGFHKFAIKVKENTKSGYNKAKKYTKDKIHDKEKDIAYNVLQETRNKVKSKKDSQILKEASNIVEENYAKGGEIKYNEISLYWKGLSGRDMRYIGKFVVSDKTLNRIETELSAEISIDVEDEVSEKPVSYNYVLDKVFETEYGKMLKSKMAKGGETSRKGNYTGRVISNEGKDVYVGNISGWNGDGIPVYNIHECVGFGKRQGEKTGELQSTFIKKALSKK